MKLTVIQYAGGPPSRELSAFFQPPGGSIGRSTGCDLTLDDPECRLSQVQALLTSRHDGWYLRNASPITPIEVNGRLLPLDQEFRLQGNDHLRIGAYLIRSEANDSMSYPHQNSAVARSAQNTETEQELGSPPSGYSNPFADLLGGTPLSAPAPKETPLLHLEHSGAEGVEQPWVAPSYFGQLPDTSASLFAPQTPRFGSERVVSQVIPSASLDPLALFGEPTHSSDLLENLGPSSLGELPAAGSMHLQQPEHLPDNGHSSFGDDVDIGRTAFRLGEYSNLPEIAPPPPNPALFAAQESNPLFDSHPDETSPREFTAVPQEQLVPGISLELPRDGTDLEPATSHNVGSSIFEVLPAFPPASDSPPAKESSFTLPCPTTRPPKKNIPAGFAGASAPIIGPVPPYPESVALAQHLAVLPDITPPQDALDIGDLAVRLAQTRMHPPQSEVPFAATAHDDAQTEVRALESFMTAAGVEQISAAPMPLEQRMAQLGRLFRLFADGTVRLLSSRTLVKREVRAELTRVMSSANNPFKVLPSGEAVLIQMFGQHLPGFLSAEQAIGEALEDLQRHQLGMLAGTRTALLELVRQLDPAICESEVAPNGLLDRLFPQRVESRRWRHYHNRYQAVLMLTRESDFYRLVGETFLRAYEEEINHCTSTRHERNEENSA